MSLVIAMKFANGVVMVGDSFVSNCNGGAELADCESSRKIWEVKSSPTLDLRRKKGKLVGLGMHRERDKLVGGAGLYKSLMAIRYSSIEFDCINSMADVINYFVPSVVEVLRDHNFLSKENPVETIDTSFIIADVDHIFLIDEDLSVIEKKCFAATGAGYEQATCLFEQKFSNTPVSEITEEQATEFVGMALTECSLLQQKIKKPFFFLKLDK